MSFTTHKLNIKLLQTDGTERLNKEQKYFNRLLSKRLQKKKVMSQIANPIVLRKIIK
jgi:hypothetical protein